MKNYNDRLRDLREDNDLKQKDIARELNINQQVYSRYELGVRSLPIEHLIKLCKFYNVSSDWVLGIDIKEPNSRLNNISKRDKLLNTFTTYTDDELELIAYMAKAYRDFIDKK